MASATNIKFPDGRTESKNVITSFEKNGVSVLVFETDKVDNGHKVVGISYQVDGMYQNVIDQNKWKEIKGYLVEILHDQMTNEDYRIVPDEVLVTEDYIHPLGLRDENLEKIVSSYEAFKSAKEVAASVQESLEAPISSVSTEMAAPTPTVSETNNIETAPVMSSPIEEAPSTEVTNEPFVQEQKVEEPSLDPFAIADSLEAGAQKNIEEPKQEAIPVDVPVGNETNNEVPIIPIIGQGPEANSSTMAPLGDVAQDSVLSQDEASIPSQPEIIGEDIIPPQVDLIQNIPDSQTIQSEPVSVLQPATNETLEINSASLEGASNEMVESLQPATEEMVVSPSAVQNTYETAAGSIVEQARALTENYIKEINELSAKYLQEMEEMRSELSRNLEEAKGINELSKQTFDKAQSMAPIQEGPSLGLSKAA